MNCRCCSLFSLTVTRAQFSDLARSVASIILLFPLPMGNKCSSGGKSRAPRRLSPSSLASHALFPTLGVPWTALDSLTRARALDCQRRVDGFGELARASAGGDAGTGLPNVNGRAFLAATETDLELIAALPIALHTVTSGILRAKGVSTAKWDVAIDRLVRLIDYTLSILGKNGPCERFLAL